MVFWSLVESKEIIKYMKEISMTEKKDGIPCVISSRYWGYQDSFCFTFFYERYFKSKKHKQKHFK